MDNSKIKTLLLTGSTGVIGKSVKDYFFKFHPNIKVICLFNPFSLQNLHEVLKDGNVDYFVNAVGAPSNDASKNDPFNTFDVNSNGVLKQLEIIRRYSPKTRYVNMGSIYENQNTPYASSKKVARDYIKTYRENYEIFAIQVTLGFTEYYNRTPKFITRKITQQVAKIYYEIKNGLYPCLIELENSNDKFNFTWGEDIACGIYKLLNQDAPKEYTLINPNSCTLYDFTSSCFKFANLIPEKNIIRVVSNRQSAPTPTINNPSFWSPVYSYEYIAEQMTKFDIENYKNE